MSSQPTERAALRPFQPRTFGRFTLLAPLASGGMGQVFLARSTFQGGLEKLCVIKKVLPQLARDPEFIERFMAEARTLVRLQHGSIAQVYDTGSFDDEYWIAMEFIDGKDLRRLLQRVRASGSRVPRVLAIFIAVKILEALAYAHRQKDEGGLELGLVHRDISPQNILVSYEGEVKVIDFGLARSKLVMEPEEQQAVLGKLFYMAPEQARGDEVDRRGDLYSLGLVLYELLLGKNPFEEHPRHQLFARVSSPRIPPIRAQDPSLPEGVAQVVDRALAPDPEARFRNAEQMRAALSSLLAELAPDVGPEQLATYMSTLFAEEHQRERELLVRFSQRQEGEGAFLNQVQAPEEETRPIEGSPGGPETSAIGRAAPRLEGLAAGPQLESLTLRFDDEREAPDSGERPPAHLSAPTFRGSGLPDLPWDRRGSGSSTQPHAQETGRIGASKLPWNEGSSEADRLFRLQESAAVLPAATADAPPSEGTPREFADGSERSVRAPQRAGPSPQRAGLSPQQAGLPPQQAGLSPQQAGLSPQQAGLSPQQAGPPPQQAVHSPQQTGSPPQQAVHSPQQTGSPLQQAAAVSQQAAAVPQRAAAVPRRAAAAAPLAPEASQLEAERRRWPLVALAALLLLGGFGTWSAGWLRGSTAVKEEAASLPQAAASASSPPQEPSPTPAEEAAPAPSPAERPAPPPPPTPIEGRSTDAPRPPPHQAKIVGKPAAAALAPSHPRPAAPPPPPQEAPPSPAAALAAPASTPTPAPAQVQTRAQDLGPTKPSALEARRREILRRRAALRKSLDELVERHGAGRVGGIVIELERSVSSSVDRFIERPDEYDSLERQLDELGSILDERRGAFAPR